MRQKAGDRTRQAHEGAQVRLTNGTTTGVLVFAGIPADTLPGPPQDDGARHSSHLHAPPRAKTPSCRPKGRQFRLDGHYTRLLNDPKPPRQMVCLAGELCSVGDERRAQLGARARASRRSRRKLDVGTDGRLS